MLLDFARIFRRQTIKAMSERNTKSPTNSFSSRGDSRAGRFVDSRSPRFSTPYSTSYLGYTVIYVASYIGGLFTYGRAYRS
jgi:hypothetical protein